MYSRSEVYEATKEYFSGDELAANVFVTKYALRDKEGNFLEKTPDDMHERIASEFSRIEENFGGERKLSKDEIYKLIQNFDFVVPQGSPMAGIGNNQVNVSLSNCVVVDSPQDNVSSIIDSGKNLANLFKRRCGVGIDLSTLRPDGTPVNNSAGTTTGAWSFADFYSYVCRMIGQNGRRGALMISMDVRHPDIEQFVTMKHDLTKVTGANVSVKISDSFMHAVENNEKFTLQFPVESEDPQFVKEINASELWAAIVDSATKTAEPGLLMWDNIISTLPAQEYKSDGFQTLTTNPCGEIPLSAYDSCRLISINLKSFVKSPFTTRAKFDFEHFAEVAGKAMRLSDDLVELEIEKLQNIMEVADTPDEKQLWSKLLDACRLGRRTGLGTHGLADAIACLGMRYDSPQATKVIDKIYGTLKVSAYTESAHLADERGSFPVFVWEKEKNNKFIKSLPEEVQLLMAHTGRRNISILTNAPTGSVSIMSQTSSGLEPVFRNFYTRRRKISHNDDTVQVDFVDELGDRWSEYKVFHHNVRQWQQKKKSDEIPEFFVESDQIDYLRRIEIQAVIQKHIDHSISSTINLPKDTTPETVAELYMRGWKLGLKGVTVYVDGSRTGVLVTEEKEESSFVDSAAPKRPELLECDIHHTSVKGEKFTVFVGLMNGRPYEVLGGLSTYVEIPKKYDKGQIKKYSYKTKASRYDLHFGEDGIIKDIGEVFDNPNYNVHTRMLSLSLRHGAKSCYLVEQLGKGDKDSDFTSFSKVIARVLKKYIADGEKVNSDKVCGACGEDGLIYVDGCVSCRACGNSKCS